MLTKVDLMNAGTDVGRYLTNLGVPADLQLVHGYFAVRNRSPAESRGGLTVRDGFAAEADYFARCARRSRLPQRSRSTARHGHARGRAGWLGESVWGAVGRLVAGRLGWGAASLVGSDPFPLQPRWALVRRRHPLYGGSSLYKERLGVPPLTQFLSRVLLEHVRQHMPAILSEVTELYQATERNLSAMGPAVPPDEHSRGSLVQSTTASFCRDFVGALVEKRADMNTGRKIKDSFVALQQHVRDVHPFDSESYSDEYLREAVRDCEGIHLSFPIPPIELLEHMLQHPERRPIHQLLAPCMACLTEVHEQLRAMTRLLLQSPAVCRFPKLVSRLREETDGLLSRAHATTQERATARGMAWTSWSGWVAGRGAWAGVGGA